MIKRPKGLLNKISRQFLLYYLLAFIISALCLFVIFIIVGTHLNDKFSSGIYDRDSIKSYLQDHTLEELYNQYKLTKGSSIVLVDENNVIKDAYNYDKEIGYKYNESEMNKIYDEERTLPYFLANKDILILHLSDNRYIITEEYIRQMYLFMFLSILLSIIFIIVFFSRVSAKMIVKPIRKLATGVNNIRLGDYTTRIEFKSKNELGQLRETINSMAETIENEISLREKAENNRKKLILDISHDLKTPLTNIQGYSETIMSNSNIDNETKQSLSIIVSNSRKANNLLTDLVDLSHLSYSSDIVLENEDLCEFIRELVIDYIPEFEANNIGYCIDIPDDKIYVKMNKGKLNRAISNLINNAIKYVKDNPNISFDITTSNDMVYLTIKDNGPGIPEELAIDIFEPFVRVDSSRNSDLGGTGLGLSITKAIIELHGGSIYIDTEYTNGASFVLVMPLNKNN